MPSHYPIDPTRVDLAREFQANPLGPHRAELARVVTRMRWGELAGRYVLVTRVPHREWVLGRLSGRRGVDVALLEDEVFTSRAEAEWAVFRRRWREITGEALAVE